MNVRVIKPIKGLEIGDILTFSTKSYNYELVKETSDITETTLNTSKCRYSFGEYTIKNNSEYFQFIDEKGIPITLVEGEEINEITKYYDKGLVEPTVVEDPKDKVISDLKDENKKLQKELGELKSTLEPIYTISVDVSTKEGQKVLEILQEKDILKEENKKLQEKLDSIKWISKDEYIKYKLFNSIF